MSERSCAICGSPLINRHISALKCLNSECQRTAISKAVVFRKAQFDLLLSYHLYAIIPIDREPTKDEIEIARETITCFFEDFKKEKQPRKEAVADGQGIYKSG